MKKVGCTQRRSTEKAVIDALLKISEIVQKTEASRQYQKSININKPSKNTIGDGDYHPLNNVEQEQVPMPPLMRTLASYVSDFKQQSIQIPSNCNQASTHRSKINCPSNVQDNDNQSSEKHRTISNDYKRHYSDTSSSSNNQHRKKSLKCHRSFQSNQTSSSIYQELKTIENQPTRTACNSQTSFDQIKSVVTSIVDDQLSSLTMMPNTPIHTISPAIVVEQQQPSKSSMVEKQHSFPSTKLSDSKVDFNVFLDQQLQMTLEKHLKDHSQSPITMNHEYIQQRANKLVTLTKSETGKLMDKLDFPKQVCNLEHYEKQCELAIVAAKQGNYSLSYSIYTNLLHDNQYDYQLKSQILASRATTLLLERKCFESIEDCTQAIAFNQWNKLAYVVRAACWMIKYEYSKAVDDYSKLFHFFDQSQQVLDLLNLAYEKLKTIKNNSNVDDGQTIEIEHEKKDLIKDRNNENNTTQQSLASASPTASFIQPAICLCYPHQPYPTWSANNQKQQSIDMAKNTSYTSQPSLIANQSRVSSQQPYHHHHYQTKYASSQSIHSNNNAIQLTPDPIATIEHQSPYSNQRLQSNLVWIKHPYRSF